MLYLSAALVVFGIVMIDQLSKYLIVENLVAEGASTELIPGVLRFTYLRNGNGMMGLFGEIRWVFVLLSVVIVAGIAFYFWKKRPTNRLLVVALSFLAGGGIGNMIDRVFQPDGKVVDFIDFCAFPKIWHYTFNVADIFVCVGVGLMMLYLILDAVHESRKEKQRMAEEKQNESKGSDVSGT